MKIFVGLDNPTPEYAATKHNVGFMLADMLADKLSADTWREKFNALVAESFYNGEKILIVKPQTFMNLSGEAVAPITSTKYLPSWRISYENLRRLGQSHARICRD